MFSLSLMLMLLANYGFNLHSHQLETGEIITHAHPYPSDSTEKRKIPGHEHNGDEIYYYSSLYLLFFAFPLLFVFAQNQIHYTIILLSESGSDLQDQFSFETRGPPVA
ncbi:MAG: hypothetical protein ACOCYO_01670 [Bacteroidota bacterium]